MPYAIWLRHNFFCNNIQFTPTLVYLGIRTEGLDKLDAEAN